MVVVALDSLVFAGVVVVPEDFGVGAVSGIFGGLAVPVGSSGLAAGGVSEAFGVGVAAPGVVGVGVIGVVGVGVATAGVGRDGDDRRRWALWAPSLFSAA